MICFLHIPKCGGSSARQFIRDSFLDARFKSDPRKTIFVYGPNTKMGDINISAYQLEGVETSPSQVKAVVGHVTLSELVHFLGHSNTFSNSFTLVREPISRALSNINYIRTNSSHKGHKFFTGINKDNLYEYLCNSARDSGQATYQLRWLTKFNDLKIKNDVDGAIEEALACVRVYKVENIKKALSCCIKTIPEQSIITKANETSSGGRKGNLSFIKVGELFTKDLFTDKQMLKLEDIFRPDIELWKIAQ